MTYEDVQFGVNRIVALHAGKPRTWVSGELNIWYIFGINQIEEKFANGVLMKTGSTHIDMELEINNLLTDIGNFFGIEILYVPGMDLVSQLWITVANILGVEIS